MAKIKNTAIYLLVVLAGCATTDHNAAFERDAKFIEAREDFQRRAESCSNGAMVVRARATRFPDAKLTAEDMKLADCR